MDYYLAVDIGASSGRHILGWIDDGVLKLEEIYRFPNGISDCGDDEHTLVWNIEQLVNEVKAGIKKCAQIGKIPKITAIDTWGVDYVLLDENGNEILPAVSYRDKRGAEIQQKAAQIMTFEQLYAKTGIQHQNFNTVYQLYCDVQSGKLANAKRFLMIPEYLSYKLTGNAVNEYTNASTTSMLNAQSGDWDSEILQKFGINPEIFTKPVLPCTKIGEFNKEMQEYAGFNSTVITCPSHDTASAVAACPIDDDSVYISSGTWSLIGIENGKAITTEQSIKANFTNEGGIERRFRFLKNLMGMWLFQNIRKNLDCKLSFDEMMNLAKQSGDYVIFDVNSSLLTAPENMIEAIKQIIGDKPLGTVINSTYHSLAKAYKSAVEEIENISGKSVSSIFIVGGGSKDSYLNTLTAQYTGKKVITGLKEATATGNIISQIMYDKGITLNEAREIIKRSFDIKQA